MKQVLRSDIRLHIVLMVTYNMDWPAAGVVGVVANEVRLAVFVLAMGASVAALAATNSATLLLSAPVLDWFAFIGDYLAIDLAVILNLDLVGGDVDAGRRRRSRIRGGPLAVGRS